MNIPETYDYLVRALVGLVGQAGRPCRTRFYSGRCCALQKDFHFAETVRLTQMKIRNSSPSWFLIAAALESVYRSQRKSRCRVLEWTVVRQVHLRPPGVRRFPPS